MDDLQSLRIREARVTLERFQTGRIFLVQFPDVVILPVHGPVGEPAVVFRIEVGGDVLGVPAKVVLQQELGRAGILANELAPRSLPYS